MVVDEGNHRFGRRPGISGIARSAAGLPAALRKICRCLREDITGLAKRCQIALEQLEAFARFIWRPRPLGWPAQPG